MKILDCLLSTKGSSSNIGECSGGFEIPQNLGVGSRKASLTDTANPSCSDLVIVYRWTAKSTIASIRVAYLFQVGPFKNRLHLTQNSYLSRRQNNHAGLVSSFGHLFKPIGNYYFRRLWIPSDWSRRRFSSRLVHDIAGGKTGIVAGSAYAAAQSASMGGTATGVVASVGGMTVGSVVAVEILEPSDAA
jgi:hypothetical protein